MHWPHHPSHGLSSHALATSSITRALLTCIGHIIHHTAGRLHCSVKLVFSCFAHDSQVERSAYGPSSNYTPPKPVPKAEPSAAELRASFKPNLKISKNQGEFNCGQLLSNSANAGRMLANHWPIAGQLLANCWPKKMFLEEGFKSNEVGARERCRRDGERESDAGEMERQRLRALMGRSVAACPD
jgi:hypothetical protein